MSAPMTPEPAGLSDAECDAVFMRGPVIAALEALAPASSGSDDDFAKAMRHLIRAIASALGTRSEVQEAARVLQRVIMDLPTGFGRNDVYVAVTNAVPEAFGRAALGEAPK